VFPANTTHSPETPPRATRLDGLIQAYEVIHRVSRFPVRLNVEKGRTAPSKRGGVRNPDPNVSAMPGLLINTKRFEWGSMPRPALLSPKATTVDTQSKQQSRHFATIKHF